MTPTAPFRIYSKRGAEKAYLRLEGTPPVRSWVRGWRDATAFQTRTDAEAALDAAHEAEPERPLCIVVLGRNRATFAGVI